MCVAGVTYTGRTVDASGIGCGAGSGRGSAGAPARRGGLPRCGVCRGATAGVTVRALSDVVSEPMLTWTYPMPSGADGHNTLTQLPRSRVTGSTVPCETCPITGLPLLGPL